MQLTARPSESDSPSRRQTRRRSASAQNQRANKLAAAALVDVQTGSCEMRADLLLSRYWMASWCPLVSPGVLSLDSRMGMKTDWR